MSAWIIQCDTCKSSTNPGNIAYLLSPKEGYIDKQGWFLCKPCKHRGFIKKEFNLQEGSQWKPLLKGVIRPNGYKDNTYQPFAFLVSYKPEDPPEDVWFCYYKDTREYDEDGKKTGGRLKMGHGPGGPPVFAIEDVQDIIDQMAGMGCLGSTSLPVTV